MAALKIASFLTLGLLAATALAKPEDDTTDQNMDGMSNGKDTATKNNSKRESLDTSNSFNLISSPGNYGAEYYNEGQNTSPYYANSYSYDKYLVPPIQYSYYYPGHPYLNNGFYNHGLYQYHPAPSSFGFYDYYNTKSPLVSSGNPHYSPIPYSPHHPITTTNYYYRPPFPYYYTSGGPAAAAVTGAGISNYQAAAFPASPDPAHQTVYNLPVLNARLNRDYHH